MKNENSKNKIVNILMMAAVLVLPYVLAFFSIKLSTLISNMYWQLIKLGITNIYVSGFAVWIFAIIMLTLNILELKTSQSDIKQTSRLLLIHIVHVAAYLVVFISAFFLKAQISSMIYWIVAAYHSTFSYMLAMNTVMMSYLLYKRLQVYRKGEALQSLDSDRNAD